MTLCKGDLQCRDRIDSDVGKYVRFCVESEITPKVWKRLMFNKLIQKLSKYLPLGSKVFQNTELKWPLNVQNAAKN